MTRTDTDYLKRAVDLRKIVAETHKIKNGKIICPFHQEKTGSCAIHKEYYKCFGCGAKGDAITWLVEYGQLTFREAVAELERRTGLAATKTVIRRPTEAATLAIEAAEWYNQRNNPEFFEHMEYPEPTTPSDIVAAYRRVRTPWLAARMRALAAEWDEENAALDRWAAAVKAQILGAAQ